MAKGDFRPGMEWEGMECEYMLLCTNPAGGVVIHHILGNVPTCPRCAKRFNQELISKKQDKE